MSTPHTPSSPCDLCGGTGWIVEAAGNGASVPCNHGHAPSSHEAVIEKLTRITDRLGTAAEGGRRVVEGRNPENGDVFWHKQSISVLQSESDLLRNALTLLSPPAPAATCQRCADGEPIVRSNLGIDYHERGRCGRTPFSPAPAGEARLREYVQHKPDCRKLNPAVFDPKQRADDPPIYVESVVCSCGLDALLTAAPVPQEETR